MNKLISAGRFATALTIDMIAGIFQGMMPPGSAMTMTKRSARVTFICWMEIRMVVEVRDNE